MCSIIETLMKQKKVSHYDENVMEALAKLPKTIFDKKHNLTIIVRNDQARSNQTRFEHIARKDHQLKVRDIESIPEGVVNYVRYVKSHIHKETYYYFIKRKGESSGFIQMAVKLLENDRHAAYIKTIFITYRVEENRL